MAMRSNPGGMSREVDYFCCFQTLEKVVCLQQLSDSSWALQKTS